MNHIIDAFSTGFGILWKALWALIFGYTISAGIQVLVTRSQMAKTLGDRGPKQVVLAGFFGLISSSCSFAALAASRSVLAKGAHSANAAAFLIASTNLVIELGLVLWVLLGWSFAVANWLLGIVMMAYYYGLTKLWSPDRLADEARAHAERAEEAEGGMHHDMDHDQQSWKEKLSSRKGWQAIADSFFMEWKMAYREILFGFIVAGFITVFVPDRFWNALFMSGNGGFSSVVALIENALVAPIIAFFTFYRIGGQRSVGGTPVVKECRVWWCHVISGCRSGRCDGDLGERQVLWLALHISTFRTTLREHGGCGHHCARDLCPAGGDPL